MAQVGGVPEAAGGVVHRGQGPREGGVEVRHRGEAGGAVPGGGAAGQGQASVDHHRDLSLLNELRGVGQSFFKDPRGGGVHTHPPLPPPILPPNNFVVQEFWRAEK